MSSKSSDTADDARPHGRLRVEVPHWAATVNIYDSNLQPVAELDVDSEKPRKSGVYDAAADVAPGIYDVEVSLSSQSERRLVAVYPNQTAHVGAGTWNLRVSSAVPTPADGALRTAAETWSRRTTWKQSPGGDSRLFLFLHTPKPERHPAFANGLFLLDADHRPLLRLDEGSHVNAKAGWLAFSAELPAGYYILRRGRRGVRVRSQGVQLCPGWETHVFLTADSRPSLRGLTLTMARLGAGFHADDRTIAAAELILDGLLHDPKSLTARSGALLDGARENPWLQILAGYALLGTPGSGVVPDALNLTPEHPDARAIRLDDNEPASAPFRHPPLLRLGLDRVQRHSTRHAGTIPLDSLTDCVLDGQVANSPWTAWRHLDRAPLPELDEPIGARSTRMIDLSPAAPRSSSLTAALIQSATPAAPVLHLDEVLGEGPALADTAPVIQAAHVLNDAGDVTALPETAEVNPGGVISDLLSTVAPADVSAASGLPLARTEDGLNQLRLRAGDEPGPGQPLSGAERTVLDFAIKNRTPIRPESVTRPATVLQDLIAGLRTEAQRMLLRLDDEPWRDRQGDPTTALGLGTRLQRTADDLLRRADFTVVADVGDHLISCDAAFLDLISSPGDAPDAAPTGHDHRRAWQTALADAPLGHSTLGAPVPNRIGEQWELWRTRIDDPRGRRPHAFLNVLRCEDVERPTGATLEHVKELLSQVQQYAAFFSYGAKEKRPAYAQQLTSAVGELETTVATG
jgi:hypothetical protein